MTTVLNMMKMALSSNDFLSTLCQNWEKEAQKAKSESTKVAIFRFGIVLGKNGGAFKR